MEKYRRFSIPEEVVEWTRQNYKENDFLEYDCLEKENFALTLYKGNGYSYMNKSIRCGNCNPEVMDAIKTLQHFLLSKKTNESIEVYRFVDRVELNILTKETKNNRIYTYPGFLSTTLLPLYYSMEDIKKRRTLITIRVPKGTAGRYLKEVNSSRPEYEFLLPYHTNLKKIKKYLFEIESKNEE